jgi:UDP-N-acetylmuramyl tripeptide synthase
LNQATAADVVVVAGRGHETVQHIGGETRSLSDAEVIRELLSSPKSRAAQSNHSKEQEDG